MSGAWTPAKRSRSTLGDWVDEGALARERECSSEAAEELELAEELP